MTGRNGSRNHLTELKREAASEVAKFLVSWSFCFFIFIFIFIAIVAANSQVGLLTDLYIINIIL